MQYYIRIGVGKRFIKIQPNKSLTGVKTELGEEFKSLNFRKGSEIKWSTKKTQKRLNDDPYFHRWVHPYHRRLIRVFHVPVRVW